MGWTKTLTLSLASGSVNSSIFTHSIVQRNLDCLDIPGSMTLINYTDDLMLIRQGEKKGLWIKPLHRSESHALGMLQGPDGTEHLTRDNTGPRV